MEEFLKSFLQVDVCISGTIDSSVRVSCFVSCFSLVFIAARCCADDLIVFFGVLFTPYSPLEKSLIGVVRECHQLSGTTD